MDFSSFLFVHNDIVPENYHLIKEVNIFLDSDNFEKNYHYLDFIPENIEKLSLHCDNDNYHFILKNLPKKLKTINLVNFLPSNKLTIENSTPLNIITSRLDLEYLNIRKIDEFIVNRDVVSYLSPESIFNSFATLISNCLCHKILIKVSQKHEITHLIEIFNKIEQLQNYQFNYDDSNKDFTLITLLKKY